jgi:hypothetical protein
MLMKVFTRYSPYVFPPVATRSVAYAASDASGSPAVVGSSIVPLME